MAYNELAVLAEYADAEEGEDAAAVDGRWFAGLPPELRAWLRAVAETYPLGPRAHG